MAPTEEFKTGVASGVQAMDFLCRRIPTSISIVLLIGL